MEHAGRSKEDNSKECKWVLTMWAPSMRPGRSASTGLLLCATSNSCSSPADTWLLLRTPRLGVSVVNG